MFAQRVRPDELIDLLAAESYDPVLMEYCAYTQKSPKLEAFLTDKARLGVTGTIANAYVPEGTDAAVPYLTTKQVGGLYAHLDGCKYITAEADKDWAKCRVPDGAIVLNKSGNVGAAAIVACAPYSYVNTVSDLINIRPRRPGVNGKGRAIDSAYLVVFLNSPFGQSQLQRLSGGAVFDHVSLYAVPEIRVFEPHFDAQRYIGDKVRLAERLRERARSLEAQFRKSVEVPVTAMSAMVGKTSRVQTTELGRNLNPGAYAPDRRAVRAAIRRAGGRMLDTLADIESPTTNGYNSNDAYVGLDAIDSATCGLKPSTAGSEAVAGTARLLREGPAISRLRPYLNKVTYIPLALASGIGSTELLLVRPKAGVDGWFLYGVLKLESSVRQLNPVATGSTHPRVDRDDVLELLVPWRDDHAPLGAKLRVAQDCYFASATLTAVATLLVEHLIEGKVTEADLITAQKALESDERGPDRAILQTLRRNGNPLQPLIPDLDAFYALLDELDAEVAQ